MKSTLSKVIVISVIVLALIIPLQMIRSLGKERQERRAEMYNEMTDIWGGSHNLIGPFIINNKKFLSPEDIEIKCDLQSDIRKKGIFKIPFYTGTVRMKGTFKIPFKVTKRNKLILFVTDKKSIEVTKFILNNKKLNTYDIAKSADHIALDLSDSGKEMTFILEIKLQGIDKFHLLPLGKKTEVYLTSNWPHPNFTGAHLPTTRDITKKGFKAYWELSNIKNMIKNKNLSSILSYSDDYSFGINIFIPVDIYHKTERAIKYGILFVVLTFLAFFLFEIFNSIKVHPIQYTLVGFSLCLFYLLLLSLSEHIPFFFSYFLATISTITCISLYSLKFLSKKIHSIYLSILLSIFYIFMFILLHLEEYTLIIGSVSLFIILTVVMYTTRNINWYELPGNTKKSGTGTR